MRAARSAENESLDRWVAVNDPVIERQFTRRGRSSDRPVDMPLTTAALEQLARPITAALHPRRYALKNRERLNRLLMLMQLHINGQGRRAGLHADDPLLARSQRRASHRASSCDRRPHRRAFTALS